MVLGNDDIAIALAHKVFSGVLGFWVKMMLKQFPRLRVLTIPQLSPPHVVNHILKKSKQITLPCKSLKNSTATLKIVIV